MSNTKEKASIDWHFTCQVTRIYENFKEQYFRSIHSTSWLFEDLILMSNMKEKVTDLVRLHEAMQEELKTAWYSKQIQILTSVLINGLKCIVENILMSLNTLSELHMKSKVGGILAKLAPKKRKNYHDWNTSSGNKRFWRWQFQ